MLEIYKRFEVIEWNLTWADVPRLMPSVDPFSGNCCWGCHFLFVIVSLAQEITIMTDKKTVSAVWAGQFSLAASGIKWEGNNLLDSAETE